MTRVGSQRHSKKRNTRIMGPPSYMRSVVDRNVVMRRITVYGCNRKSKIYGKSLFVACQTVTLPKFIVSSHPPVKLPRISQLSSTEP